MNKFRPIDKFSEHIKRIKPDENTQNLKILCDWTDKKKYFIHYSILNFFVSYGMVVDEVHEIISVRQSKCLEKQRKLLRRKEIRLETI